MPLHYGSLIASVRYTGSPVESATIRTEVLQGTLPAPAAGADTTRTTVTLPEKDAQGIEASTAANHYSNCAIRMVGGIAPCNTDADAVGHPIASYEASKRIVTILASAKDGSAWSQASCENSVVQIDCDRGATLTDVSYDLLSDTSVTLYVAPFGSGLWRL